jgi:hypothetical protein
MTLAMAAGPRQLKPGGGTGPGANIDSIAVIQLLHLVPLMVGSAMCALVSRQS